MRNPVAESRQGETDFVFVPTETPGTGFDLQSHIPSETVSPQPEKTGMPPFSEESDIPASVIPPLNNDDSSQRSIGLTDLERFGAEDAFHIIARAFDDESEDIRNSAARALFELQPDRVASFARMLREGSPDRRRRIAAAIAASARQQRNWQSRWTNSRAGVRGILAPVLDDQSG